VAILILLLILFAAVAVFLILVIGFMLLLAVGTDIALVVAVLMFIGLSALGGLALSAISRQMAAPHWSWPVASGLFALVTALEFGISLLISSRS
jgi:hypothetical protein